MASLAELPSFSRIGKNCSNLAIIKDMEAKSERDHKMRSRGRSTPTYQSLADTPPLLAGFNVDTGKRSRQIVSSPRMAPSLMQAQGGGGDNHEGLRFERVMKWDEFPAEARAVKDNKARGAGEGVGRPEHKLRPKQDKKVVPSASFKTTDRDNDHLTLRAREQGRLAPAVGHYDASQDIVRVKHDKLAYIANKERPNAPTYKVEKLARSVPSLKEAPLKPLTPRSSFHVLKELDKLPASSPATTKYLKRALTPTDAHLTPPSPTKTTAPLISTRLASASSQTQTLDGEGGGEDGAAAQGVQQDQQAQHAATLNSSTAMGTLMLSLASQQAVIPSRMPGPDMSRMLPRNNPTTGAPTLHGYQISMGGGGSDTMYQTEKLRFHVPTPDLSRSGKDYMDQLQRLGYIPPETVASPIYKGYDSPVDWLHPQGWIKATRRNASSCNVSLDTMLPRRPATSSRDSLRVELRNHRDGKMWDGCIPDDKNPSFAHMPTFIMARSSSVHKPLVDVISHCKHEGPYNVSERLIRQRTQQILPFNRMLERRPLTSDSMTGRPMREVNDLVYETFRPEMTIVRPRSMSPVEMHRSQGRDGFGGIVQESGSGGLHGTNFWGEIGWRTEAVADVIRFKRLPNMAVTPARKQPKSNQYGNSSASEPMSTAAQTARLSGSGVLWDPKDSVMKNIPTPNLDTNERSRDAERSKKHTLTQDLHYDVNHSLTEPRIPSAVIYKGNLGPPIF